MRRSSLSLLSTLSCNRLHHVQFLSRGLETSTEQLAQPAPKAPSTEEVPPPPVEHPLQQTHTLHEEPQHTKSFWAVEPPLPLAEHPVRLRNNSRFVPLCFDNSEAAFRGVPTSSLVRSIAVFSACRIKPLVQHADTLYRGSQRLVGKWLTGLAVRHTFYGHFCAGKDQDSIQPKIRELHEAGIGAILDYAAESDVHSEKGVPGAASLTSENYEVIVRTYDYESEVKCDAHVDIFMRALEAAKTLPGQGFAAVKVTALGNPELLRKLTKTINEIKRLFSTFDQDGNGYVTRQEFFEVYDKLFLDSERAYAEALFEKVDIVDGDEIDYVSFIDNVQLEDIPEMTSRCRSTGPLKMATPTQEELLLMQNMIARVRKLCKVAADSNLRIMIDAEHSYFQPAIDSIAKDMMREFNTERPIVYNTYQCYLKDSRFRLNADIESARRQGYKFGAKLVRGAYMVLERELADKEHYPSPIHDTATDTHTNYNRCVRMLIQEAATAGAEVMIATHNQYSVEMAVRSMHDWAMVPSECGVFFGQLLGMADHLSYTLGRHHHRAYKYVPFGPLEEVMPYLIRRAQENSDIMGGVGKEYGMLMAEVKRRVTGWE